MFQGTLIGIFLCSRKADRMEGVDQVEAMAGRGLTGDRYFLQEGTYSKKEASPDREVTLIESEALEGLQREYGISLEPIQTRRNLLTRQVPLNHLVGKEFSVGQVMLRGIRLCEPCGHLEKLTLAGVHKGLVHRGGLRAQIVQGGTLKKGDMIILPS